MTRSKERHRRKKLPDKPPDKPQVSFFKLIYLKVTLVMIVLIAAVLIYRPVFNGGFVFDDYFEVVNKSPIKVGFAESVQTRPFRAIPTAVNRLDYLIAGSSARFYHITNLFFHILSALALALFWRKAALWVWNGDKESAWWTGAVAGAIFLFHPLNTEAVAYVSSLGDVMAAGFIFVALFCLVKAFESGSRGGWFLTALVALSGALFSKETAIIGPVLAAMLIFMVEIKEKMVTGKKTPDNKLEKYGVNLFIPFLLILVGWSVFRLSHRVDLGVRPGDTVVRTWATPIWALGTYTKMALWPFGMRLDHGSAPAIVMNGLGAFLIGVFSLAAGVIGAYSLAKSRNRFTEAMGFAVLWWIVALSVAVLTPLADVIAERRVYIAMGAISGLPAMAAVYLRNRGKAAMFGIVSATLALVLFLGTSAAVNSIKWSSARSLWTNAVRWQPASARAWTWLGEIWLEAGQLNSAKRAFEAVLKLKPSYSKPETELGVIAAKQGYPTDAAKHFRSAIAKDPGDWYARVNLGALESERGNYAEAEKQLKGALLFNDDRVTTWFNLGNVYLATGRVEDAKNAYRKALTIDPRHDGARINYAKILEDSWDLSGASREVNIVLTRNPEYPPALLAASRLEYRLGDKEASIKYLKRYLVKQGKDAEAWDTLVKMLRQTGNEAEARKAAAKAASLK